MSDTKAHVGQEREKCDKGQTSHGALDVEHNFLKAVWEFNVQMRKTIGVRCDRLPRSNLG